jgi:hypothetical protein
MAETGEAANQSCLLFVHAKHVADARSYREYAQRFDAAPARRSFLDIVVRQNTNYSATEIVILAVLERPHESNQSGQAKQQGHGEPFNI